MKESKQFFSSPVFLGLLFSAALFYILPHNTLAQPHPSNSFYTVWGGYSFNSVAFLGKTKHSQTQIFALGYRNPIEQYTKSGKLYYTIEMIPYLHYDYPRRDENDRRVNHSGFGLSPVGFLWKPDSSSPVLPYLHTTGGLIYMEDKFPTGKARRLNFTFDATFGASLRLARHASLSFGYKFHHISNAETGKHNPGLDSNFLFFSISIH